MENSRASNPNGPGFPYYFLKENGISIGNSLSRFIYLLLALSLPMGLLWSLHSFYKSKLDEAYHEEMRQLQVDNQTLQTDLRGTKEALARATLQNQALKLYIIKRDINLKEIESKIISSAINLNEAQSLLTRAKIILDSSRNIEVFPPEIRHLKDL